MWCSWPLSSSSPLLLGHTILQYVCEMSIYTYCNFCSLSLCHLHPSVRLEMDENIFRLPCYHFLMAQQPLVSHGQFTFEASWSDSDVPHLVHFLWMSDQTDAETSTWQHTTFTRDRYLWLWQDLNPQSQQASSHRGIMMLWIWVKW